MERPAWICDLGRVEYRHAAALQRNLRAAREAGTIPDTLLVLEHDPVISTGYRTDPEEVAYARTLPLPVVETERGGKATYHGPGQLVVYPILDLRQHGQDVKRLVCELEGSVIDALGTHGIGAGRVDGQPGVWVAGERKIASLGLRVTHWVSFHGLAVNVDCDLEPFSWFTACGIDDLQTTSVQLELRATDRMAAVPSVPRFANTLLDALGRRFALEPERVDRVRLDAALETKTITEVVA